MAEELLPSRAALLELRDEREVMQAGQAFLDEKRTLIAATLVRMLRRHRTLQARFRTAFLEAAEALRTALARHGLEALQAYPKEPLPAAELMLKPSELLGVALMDAELDVQIDQVVGEDGGIRSVQAERCRQRFA
ncbi:V-type ATP synthase subunit D, partial [Acidihalobacter prosperus]